MLAFLALILPLAQDDAPGSVGKMSWPPKAATAQTFVVQTTKVRKVSAATAAKRREASKAAGVKPPAKEPKQSADVELAIAIEPLAAELKTRVTPKITAHGLRWRWSEPAEGSPLEIVNNAKLADLWGEKAALAAEMAFPRASFETPFDRTLRWRSNGVQFDQMGGRWAESLLPVLWSRALPTWAEEVFAVLHVDGEHIIPGKAMIREHTDIHPLGTRTSRAEALIEQATSDRFRLSYRLRVDQLVNRTRDLEQVLKRHYLWRFEIEGTLEHSLAEGALIQVDEKVVGTIPDASPEKLLAIYDEEFEGTIKLRRVSVEKPPDPKPKGGTKR